jgi:hypothetical protein
MWVSEWSGSDEKEKTSPPLPEIEHRSLSLEQVTSLMSYYPEEKSRNSLCVYVYEAEVKNGAAIFPLPHVSS